MAGRGRLGAIWSGVCGGLGVPGDGMSDNGKRPRRRYDDKFRASAVVMLEAAGYPDRKGALEKAAKACKAPESTLRGWYNETHNPPPAKLRAEKKLELADLLKNELGGIFRDMPGARPDASYRDLGTVAAIFIDKLQLLEGKPTLIVELTNLLKEGAITPEDILNEFADAPEAAEGLFESIGLRAIEVRETQAQSAEVE